MSDRPDDPRSEAVEEMERLLRREAADRERALDEIRDEAPTADEDALMAGFRDRIRAARPAPATTAAPGSPVRWLVAAALLLVGGAWLASRDVPPPADPGRLRLGSDEVECVRPAGRVPGFESFAWRFDDLPPTASYELTVRDAADGRVVLRKRDLFEPSYRPSAGERAALPDAIEWRVRVLEAGDEIGAGSARARRR
ncbi:MAG: hypothetical protein ACF8XB_03390 [Planctomycetota bacterium JB042]